MAKRNARRGRRRRARGRARKSAPWLFQLAARTLANIALLIVESLLHVR